MKAMHKAKYFIAGVLVTVLVTHLTVPSFAALAKKTVDIYTGINIYVDDVKLNPKDAQGNPIEPFVYNGTTYLPVRAVGEAVGKAIQWDAKTNSVYFGKHESVTPTVWIKDLDYFTKDGQLNKYDTAKDNLGNTHMNVVSGYNGGFEQSYVINGQYSRIKGVLFQMYDYRSDNQISTLSIYGDGQLLYTSEMTGGQKPIDFDVDISGVLELKISLDTPGGSLSVWSNECAALGECGLYTN